MSNSPIPVVHAVGLINRISELLGRNVAGIGGVSWKHRLGYYQLPGVYSSLLYLHYGCSREGLSRLFNQILEVVVFAVPLVVELDYVEVYQVPHCLVDCYIGPVFVEFLFEVGSLRAMGDNMIRNNFS